MTARVRYRELDWILLGLIVLVSLLGFLEIYSTTLHHPRFAGMHLRQLMWLAIGFLLLLLFARLDYHHLIDQAHWIYLATIGGLGAVLIFGTAIFGARRWLEIGGVTFQMSEFAKLGIIIVLAKVVGEIRGNAPSLKDLAKVAFLVGVPIALIAAQPDLGTALTLVPVVVTMTFLAGLRWRDAALLLLAAMLLLPAGWFLLRPYQQERLVSFLHPAQGARGPAYQTLQSKIAVGSGGTLGKGIGKGSQNQLGFIPVRHSEFIFAAYAEEQGFVGVLLALALYLALLLRLLSNAGTAADRTGGLLVAGVLSLLAFHLLVNVGMVIGYIPVTGIPLPLMSYGGSATIATLMMLGLVMSVYMRRFVNL